MPIFSIDSEKGQQSIQTATEKICDQHLLQKQFFDQHLLNRYILYSDYPESCPFLPPRVSPIHAWQKHARIQGLPFAPILHSQSPQPILFLEKLQSVIINENLHCLFCRLKPSTNLETSKFSHPHFRPTFLLQSFVFFACSLPSACGRLSRVPLHMSAQHWVGAPRTYILAAVPDLFFSVSLSLSLSRFNLSLLIS